MGWIARSLGAIGFVCALLLLADVSPGAAQVVAFGASNVAGRGVASSDAFPAQLEGMLRAKGLNVSVVNAGISGNTTADMRNRMNSDIPQGTRVVVLDTAGGLFNNFRVGGISRNQGAADMSAIAAALRARGIKIVPVTTGGLPPQYRQRDGLHLTPEGHQLIAVRVLPQVMRALGR